MIGPIAYKTGNQLNLDQTIELYRASTLGARRPVDEPDRMAQMLREANLVITAWENDLMVGIARSLSDFCYVTYLADIAVRQSHQRLGIGRELVRLTREAGGEKTSIVLLSAPAAESYYPRIGFQHHPQAWWLRQDDELS